MTTVHSFGIDSLCCHAWNKDRKKIAISPNNHQVIIYSGGGSKWEVEAVLDQHDRKVTGIDWAPNSDRIVTCSEDRNAYVWNYIDGTWKHTLVLLRINRTATCVRWSPEENKFAVGSGARIISVCYYEKENNWWVAKHIKKPLRSTVTCLDWHPNNILLAAGATDFKARVFSGYVKEIEAKPAANEWGSKMPIGHLMAEFSNSSTGGGWVHSVSFSSDGTKLAWVAHDASVNIADAANGNLVTKLRTSLLPMLSVLWTTPTTLLAAGHDFVPIEFSFSGDELVEGHKLEEDKEVKKAATSAMKMFQNKVDRGQAGSWDTKVNTTHQNQVSELRMYAGNKESAMKVSTVGGDGRMVIWDLQSISSKMGKLRV